MPRLTEERKNERRAQIAEAAMQCFADKGFAATSMADIIAASGLSAGSLYSHFESKIDLVRHVSSTKLESTFGEVFKELTEPERVITPADVLERALEAAAGQRDKIRLLLHIWVESESDAELGAVARANLGAMRGRFQTLLTPWASAQVARPGDEAAVAGAVADALIATVQGFMVRLKLDPVQDADELAAALVLAARLPA